jgi:signal transduction histidine kinase
MPKLTTGQHHDLPRAFGWQHPMIRRNLQLVFEGGPEGQRRAALLFLASVAPISITVGAVLSHHNRLTITLLRAAPLAIIIVWLLLRPAFSTRAWAGLLTIITVTNAASQLAAGASHNGVLALNGLGVFVLVCVAFESRLVVITACLFIGGYAIVQYHFYPLGDALAATLMYVVVLAAAALVVHGTALYLRDSLSSTAELHAEMDQTAEQERARIAGELHDDTIQVLTAAGLRLDEIVRRTEADQGAGSDAPIRDVREMIRHALDRTRRLTFELYPPQLERYGLRPALEALGRQIEQESPFTVAVSVGSTRFPRGVEQLAYRTIKELLANATKHSQAKHVTVEVTARSDAVSCVVADDGRGFDARAIADARRGFHIGLDAAADRVQSAGGRFEIISGQAKGTRASFTLPIEVGGS